MYVYVYIYICMYIQYYRNVITYRNVKIVNIMTTIRLTKNIFIYSLECDRTSI